jgi:hypothetical protein
VPAEFAHKWGDRREIERLVGSRLWVPADDGYLMPDFLQYNASKAERDAQLKKDAERKRAERHNSDRGSNGQYLSRRSP